MIKAKILIIEGKQGLTLDTQGKLQQWGFDVTAIAPAREEASFQPDVVLVDITGRGDADTLAAAEQIHAQFGSPLVYLAGDADSPLPQTGSVQPAGYLVRPFTDNELLITVRQAIAFYDLEKQVRDGQIWSSALRELEKQAEERRLYLERVLACAPDAIITLDARHHVQEWNEGAVKIFGYSATEAIGRELDNLIAAPDPEMLHQANTITRQLLGGTPLAPIETVRFRRDGTPVDVLLAGSPIILGEQVVGVVAVYQDISERKRAEEALRRSELQYRTTLDSLADAIHVVDRDLRIILFNTAFRNWNKELGLETETIGKKIADIFPFLPPKAFDEYRTVFETGELVVTQERISIAGRDFITETRKIPVFEQGRVSRVVTVIRDISERQRAEDEVRRLKEFNERIIQSMAEGIAVQDAEGRFTFINPAAASLLGYSADELVGQHWTMLFPPDQQPIIQAADERRRRGQADRYEVELLCKDGTRVPVLVSGSPQFQQGRFEGTIAVFADIRERVQAEEKLARRAREMAALYETSLEINSQLDVSTLLNAIVRRAAELLGVRMGGLYLVRPQEEVVELVVSYNLSHDFTGTRLRLGEGLSGRIAQTGQPMMISDYRQWPGRAAVYADEPFCRVLGVPIKVREQVIGVINVTDDKQVGLFDEDEVRLASLFADQAAIALENARLFEAERVARRQSETLRAATQALTATLDLPQVFERILTELRRVVPYDSATVQQLQGDELVIIGGYGFPNLEELIGIRFDPTATDNPNREVVRSRAPVILEDAPALYEGFKREPHAQAGIRSWLGVPLLFGDRLIGMLALDKQEPGFYTSEHASLALSFAAQAAIAIENARLFTAEREQRQLAEILREVASVLNTSLDQNQVINLILDQLGRVVDYDSASLMLLSDGQLETAAHRGFHAADERLRVLRLEDFAHLRQVIDSHQPGIIPDTHADPRWRYRQASAHIRCWLGVPLQVQDRVIGLLNLGKSEVGFYTQRDAELTVAFATQAAVAIENARLFAAEREQREMAEALHQAAQMMGASLELDEILRLLLQQLKRLVVYTTASVLILREGTLPDLVAGAGYEDEQMISREAGRLLRDSPILRQMAHDLQPVISPDVRQLDGWIWVPGAEHVRSWLGIPLVAHGRMIGALMVDHAQPGFFDSADLQRVQALAQHAAQVIENARLFQAEREQHELTEALRQAATAISSTLDLDQVLDQILEQVHRVVPGDAANIDLIEEGMARMVRWRGYERFSQQIQSLAFRVADTPTLRYMQQTGNAIVIPDTATHPDWIALPEVAWLRSYAAAPIRIRDQVIGFLNVDSATPGFFNQTHAERLRVFADQASLALEHARLYKAEQRRAEEAAAVSRVVQALNAATDLDTVLQVIDRELRQLMDLDRVSLALLAEDGQHFVMHTLSGDNHMPLRRGTTLPLSATAAVTDVTAGYPHFTPDLAAEIGFPAERTLYEAGLRSRLNLPLVLGQAVIGALNLASRQLNAFSAAQLPMLTQIADAVAATVQTVRLYQEILQRNRELALLNRVIAASAASQEIETILEVICRELALALEVPQAAAALFNEDKSAATVVAEYLAEGRPSSLGRVIPVVGNPSSQYILQHKAPLVVDNAQTDPRLTPIHDLMRQRGTVSLLLLPLLVEGEVVGSLGVDAIEMRPFSEEEVSLAWRVAEQVSGSLARARLMATQRRLSTAVEQAAEAIIIAAPDMTIQYVNPAFEQITGYSPTQAVGHTPFFLDDTGENAAFIAAAWAALRNGQQWTGRFSGKRRDRSSFIADLTVNPVRGPSGEIINYVATMRDVTREVRLEEQFQQAQKMEALGQLAGGIAHDFNNLLTVIHLSTQLLRRRLHPEDPLWEHVSRIEETGERAASLTKQLLSFSRREVVEPRLVNLNNVVGELSHMLRRIIGEDIELEIHLAQDLRSVKIDPSQVDQVILNLAVNARDAMPHGGTLTIKTANVLLDEAYAAAHVDIEPGQYVALVISDTGVGMDDTVRSHLFEPFFTTKERGQGTGLGLATVFGIVKQSRGHIQVASQVGQGTTFTIYLPCAGEVEEGTLPPPLPSPVSQMAQGTETVLIVEDKADVRQLAAEVLRACGYQVLTAEHGPEALRISSEHQGPIHLLLTDVVMPHMNGTELAEQLAGQRPGVRVLYMSGHADSTILRQKDADLRAVFLAKPFTVDSLTKKVRAVLDGRV